MTLVLTPEQSAALQQGEELRLADPATSEVYVLVPEAAFLRTKSLLADGPLSSEERKVIWEGVWRRAGWDDPAWDELARCVPEKPAQ
jgi:hypothetical protein